MTIITREDSQGFGKSGFCIIRNSTKLLELLEDVKDEVGKLALSYGYPDPFDAEEVFEPKSGDQRTRFYRSLRYLPSLGRLANSRLLSDSSREIGLALPLVMNASNIRMDQGGPNPNKFHWHQDYTYLLGSMNSITYWLPLQPVSSTLGGIEVVPGSHRESLRKFKVMNEAAKSKSSHLSPNDIVLEEEPKEPGDAVELEYGDGIVFSQFLLHRSLEHSGHRIRWTVQVRHSDALDENYRDFGCPMGDTTTILKHDTLRDELVKLS